MSALLAPGVSYAGAPGAMALQVRACDKDHVLAVWRNVVVALWVRETRLQAVDAMGSLLSELSLGGKRAALLQVAEDTAVVPSTAVREAISGQLKAHSTRMLASAVVFEGEGFRAAGARAIVSSIAFMTRLNYPHEVFSSVPTALSWIDGRLPTPGSYRSDQLERAIASLRSAARVATLPTS